LCNELPELIKVRNTSFRGSKSPNISRHVFSSLIGIVVFTLILVLSVPSLLLHERIVDEFIIQELVEDVQLLDKELVESVDYGSHDTDSMSFN